MSVPSAPDLAADPVEAQAPDLGRRDRENNRQWRAKNREKRREDARQRYAKNPEKYRENNRQWRAKNREKRREDAYQWVSDLMEW